MSAGPRGWRAYHLHYHAGLDPPLREFVAPVCAALLADGEIAGFYFVRYGLGGPHLRLRVKPLAQRAGAVDSRVRAAACAFLARHPSPTPLPDDTVRRHNQGVVASDGGVDAVIPDNTLVAAPVEFEVERYGGARLFGHSLDFFSLSSLYALEALPRNGEAPQAVRLAAASRAMIRLAWGLARDVDGIGALAGWAVRGYAGSLDAFARRGDEAFERGREALCARVRGELVALASSGNGPDCLGAAAEGLARATRRADEARRWRIAWSHLHMAANRLGLRNPEEVYLGQMLRRAVEAVSSEEPALWRNLRDAHRARHEASRVRTLRDRTREALATFAAGT